MSSHAGGQGCALSTLRIADAHSGPAAISGVGCRRKRVDGFDHPAYGSCESFEPSLTRLRHPLPVGEGDTVCARSITKPHTAPSPHSCPSPSGRRWRAAPDEGCVGVQGAGCRVLASAQASCELSEPSLTRLRHPLPVGEGKIRARLGLGDASVAPEPAFLLPPGEGGAQRRMRDEWGCRVPAEKRSALLIPRRAPPPRHRHPRPRRCAGQALRAGSLRR